MSEQSLTFFSFIDHNITICETEEQLRGHGHDHFHNASENLANIIVNKENIEVDIPEILDLVI